MQHLQGMPSSLEQAVQMGRRGADCRSQFLPFCRLPPGGVGAPEGPARRRERGGGARLSPARHGACPRRPVGPGPASRRARQEGSGVSPACGSAFGPRPVGPRTDAARPGTDLPRGRPGAGLGSPGPRARGGGRLCAGAACGPSGAAGPGGRRGPAGGWLTGPCETVLGCKTGRRLKKIYISERQRMNLQLQDYKVNDLRKGRSGICSQEETCLKFRMWKQAECSE